VLQDFTLRAVLHWAD